jgi:lipopolysaccharide/colanic/teichoic acid biosynthesis glycosyltransferase
MERTQERLKRQTVDPGPSPSAQSGRGRVWPVVKRALDVTAASVGLVVLSPLLAVAAIAVRLDSPGPILFRQWRMGRHFRPFEIYKFRTMVADAPRLGWPLTAGEDPRITRLGHLLRKAKIDELPQLVNVLRGEMSLVGPRPEVPRYVELFREDFAEILELRPGITDLASIAYRDEASLLGQSDDPEAEYVHRILPHKIALAKEYCRRSSFGFDLVLLIRTLGKLVWY